MPTAAFVFDVNLYGGGGGGGGTNLWNTSVTFLAMEFVWMTLTNNRNRDFVELSFNIG